MSIYKDRPELSIDFEIIPLEVAFSLVVPAYQKKAAQIENECFEDLEPQPLLFLPQFTTQEQRLFFSPQNQKMMLGCSNTQHNCHERQYSESQVIL